MIKNNIELDVKVKCIEHGTTQSRIAENIGTTKSYSFFNIYGKIFATNEEKTVVM